MKFLSIFLPESLQFFPCRVNFFWVSLSKEPLPTNAK